MLIIFIVKVHRQLLEAFGKRGEEEELSLGNEELTELCTHMNKKKRAGMLTCRHACTCTCTCEYFTLQPK